MLNPFPTVLCCWVLHYSWAHPSSHQGGSPHHLGDWVQAAGGSSYPTWSWRRSTQPTVCSGLRPVFSSACVHSSKFFCHPGINRTLSLLKRHFWWPTMNQDTRSFVNACSVGAPGKASNLSLSGLLHLYLKLLLVSSTVCPLHKVTLSYPPSLTASLKLPTSLPFPSCLLIGNIWTTYHSCHLSAGHSHGHCLHRWPQFTSQVWQAFCQSIGATISLTSGFHPQTNGQTERVNQDLETSLCYMATSNPAT